MREIKFRAWDGEKMLFFELFEKPWPYSMENPVMQFTGLLDKNGKEIYEGDIVSMFSGTQISAVIWDKSGCWSVVAQLSGGSLPDDQLLSNMLDTAEIIGNIYENKELLP